MLIKIEQLLVENSGYKRDVLKKEVFLNPNKIVSISNYDALEEFILSENPALKNEKFSLIKMNEGTIVSHMIAFGTAEEISARFRVKKVILHD